MPTKRRRLIFPTAKAKDRHDRAILRYFAKSKTLPLGMIVQPTPFGPKLLYVR